MKPISVLLKKRLGKVWHVSPRDSVFKALQVMAEHDVGALMVIEDGRLVGLLSERDYTRRVALAGRNSKETRVSEIMTANVYTVTPSLGTRACMSLMSEHKFRHLPVVEDGTILGMISIRDIMDDIIADHEATITQLEHYITRS